MKGEMSQGGGSMAVLQLAGEGIGTGWHWLIQNIIIFNILLITIVNFFNKFSHLLLTLY